MAGIVKEVAFDAPNLVVHLLPIRPGIDVYLHVSDLQGALAWFGRFCRFCDEPGFFALPVKNFLTVERHRGRGHPINQFVGLASF